MANYNFRSQFNYSYSAKAVVLRAKISFGSSGAPTLVSNTGMGIASVVRNSAGDFTINLSRAFGSLMSVNAIFNSGSSLPAAPSVSIKSDAVATASAPAVEIVCSCLDTPAATDPADGEVMLLEIVLNDSSLGY